MNDAQKHLPIVILAGGTGRRLGGRNKAMLPLAGKPMVLHVLARLRAQTAQSPRAILCNSKEPLNQEGLPEITDSEFIANGPLSGVLSALKWAKEQGHDAVITVPVDAPFLPDDLIERLSQNSRCIHYAAEDAGDGTLRAHPTCALWPVSLIPDLRAALEREERAMMRFIDTHAGQPCRFEATSPSGFTNINTAEECRAAERYLQGESS